MRERQYNSNYERFELPRGPKWDLCWDREKKVSVLHQVLPPKMCHQTGNNKHMGTLGVG
jgi:hypothetical protein